MIGTDVAQAADLLNKGQLVGIPTETVYGLAANALNPEAVAEIYKVKNRPSFNPLILHIGKIAEAEKYVEAIPELAYKLMKAFWPGSLSILFEKSNRVPDIITAGSSKVVLRVPNHPTTLDLLTHVDFPLAAPSANISNTVSPTSARHVEDGLGKKIPYILDGAECTVGVESTIVEVKNDMIVILRDGGISREELSRFGEVVTSKSQKDISSPGQLSKHYSTSKPLYIVPSIELYLSDNPDKKFSVLLYEDLPTKSIAYYLSRKYNLPEIANNLFKMMRLADQDDTEAILVEPVKEEGIGRAIADRLQRASFKL